MDDSIQPSSSKSSAWAWGVSLGVHVILLCVLAATKLTHAQADEENIVPQASVREIKAAAESEPVTPKPKVREAITRAGTLDDARQSFVIDTNDSNEVFAAEMHDDISTFATKVSSGPKISSSQVRQARVEFFGSATPDKKICFVVDCSGSMRGLFGGVTKELQKSIASLEADNYFNIIFFGGESIFEMEKGKLVRATLANKQRAFAFIKNIRPAGKTDPMKALRRAMLTADARGQKAGTLYFLTDGFELNPEGGKNFGREVLKMRKELAASVKINTIGFFTQDTDRPVLEAMAHETDGKCVVAKYSN